MSGGEGWRKKVDERLAKKKAEHAAAREERQEKV